jgi:hypothetical protein
VNAFNSPDQDRSPFLYWIAEVKNLVNQSQVCSFVKGDRSQVRVTHFLANLARVEHCNNLWLGSESEAVLRILGNNRLVTPPS